MCGVFPSELPLTANLSSCHVCSEVQKASKLNGTVAPHLYKHDAITLCTRYVLTQITLLKQNLLI